VSLDATRWAWTQQGLRPIQKLVLLALADRAGADDKAFPSKDQLIADTGAEQKTVWQAMKALQEMGLIADSGERRGATSQIIVWQLIGVEHRYKDSENGTVKGLRKRNGLGDEKIPKTERLKIYENGTVKGFQKRKDSENGRIPFLDGKDSENGMRKDSENGMGNLPIEPTKEPVIPPNAHAQEGGMPECIPADLWEQYRREVELSSGKPFSITRVLKCWNDLAAMDAEGYDVTKVLNRCIEYGFTTFDRREETKKTPAAGKQKQGFSKTKQVNYAGSERISLQDQGGHEDSGEPVIIGRIC
jgi:hypothetical protein